MPTSSQIRSTDLNTSSLKLPWTPNGLAKMSRSQLLKEYDRFGDYWATWLGRASMLSETQDDYTDGQLRNVIELMSGQWAHSGWKYHTNSGYDEEHRKFYEEWLEKDSEALGIRYKKRRRVSNRRPTRRSTSAKHVKRFRRRSRRRSVISSRNRHTRSADVRRSRRPGPTASAAEASVGTERKGNDGNTVCGQYEQEWRQIVAKNVS